MSEKIVFDYSAMNKAAENIKEIAVEYKQAGKDFCSDFVTSIANWEGASKDKMVKLITGAVQTMLTADIPSYLDALATLLAENVKAIENADGQIAQSIPENLS